MSIQFDIQSPISKSALIKLSSYQESFMRNLTVSERNYWEERIKTFLNKVSKITINAFTRYFEDHPVNNNVIIKVVIDDLSLLSDINSDTKDPKAASTIVCKFSNSIVEEMLNKSFINYVIKELRDDNDNYGSFSINGIPTLVTSDIMKIKFLGTLHYNRLHKN